MATMAIANLTCFGAQEPLPAGPKSTAQQVSQQLRKLCFFRVTIRPRTLWVFAKSKNSYTMSANGSCVLVIWVESL